MGRWAEAKLEPETLEVALTSDIGGRTYSIVLTSANHHNQKYSEFPIPVPRTAGNKENF